MGQKLYAELIGGIMLVVCPECQNQISDSATACPKCGKPLTPVSPGVLHQSFKLSGCFSVVALLAVLALVVVGPAVLPVVLICVVLAILLHLVGN